MLYYLSGYNKEYRHFCSRVRVIHCVPFLGITGWLIAGSELNTSSKVICNASSCTSTGTGLQGAANELPSAPHKSPEVSKMVPEDELTMQSQVHAVKKLFGKRHMPLLDADQALLVFPGSLFAFIVSTHHTSNDCGTKLYRLDKYVPLDLWPGYPLVDERDVFPGRMDEIFIG